MPSLCDMGIFIKGKLKFRVKWRIFILFWTTLITRSIDLSIQQYPYAVILLKQKASNLIVIIRRDNAGKAKIDTIIVSSADVEFIQWRNKTFRATCDGTRLKGRLTVKISARIVRHRTGHLKNMILRWPVRWISPVNEPGETRFQSPFYCKSKIPVIMWSGWWEYHIITEWRQRCSVKCHSWASLAWLEGIRSGKVCQLYRVWADSRWNGFLNASIWIHLQAAGWLAAVKCSKCYWRSRWIWRQDDSLSHTLAFHALWYER